MSEDVIKEGDHILLYYNRRKKFLVKVIADKKIHTHKGIVNCSDIIGKKYGEIIKTHVGEEFILSKPIFPDYLAKFKRATQVIHPKDLSLIVFLSGIGPGSIVVEAGTGSGFLTATLAYYVRPEGKVYSYEVRRDFLEVAKRNLKLCGLLDYVILKHKNIAEGIDEKNVDAVILDMPNPWDVVAHAKSALRHGGVFASFSPTINQVEKVVETLREENFMEITSLEVFLRKIKVKKGETRPETFMIAHTGYLVFARKP